MHSIVSVDHNTVLQVLGFLLSRTNTAPITLLCCSTRIEFLRQLQLGIAQEQEQQNQAAETGRGKQREIPASQESLGEEITNVQAEPVLDQISSLQQRHHLLIPTLQLLASSQKVKLVFCSNIPMLRAWLGHLQAPSGSIELDQLPHEITILNMISLHHGTSEFTLQGLQRSFALAVSACHRAGYQTLRTVECQDHHDPTHPHRGSALWKAEVPLLSGSIRIRDDATKWAGHAISMKSIAKKWFIFEDGEKIR